MYYLTTVAMLWRNSQFLFLFCCLTFLQVNAEFSCKPGEMATHSRDGCVPCPKNQYRPKPGKYKECLNCLPCRKYSKEVSECTPTTNTKCQCFEGFHPLESTEESCECKKGSGIKTTKNGMTICEICPNGTFTTTPNSVCQAWKRCDQSGGEEVPGSSTSDVKCRNATIEVENVVMTTIAPISTTSKASTTTDNHRRSTYLYTTTIPASSKQQGLWLGVFSAVLVFVLILCTVVKLNAYKFFQSKPNQIVRQDSVCGKPVEESGKGFSSVI